MNLSLDLTFEFAIEYLRDALYPTKIFIKMKSLTALLFIIPLSIAILQSQDIIIDAHGLPALPHVVQKGQTAYSISKMHGCTIAELVHMNANMDPKRLNLHQVIAIPYRGGSARNGGSEPLKYTVRKGDNLFHIAHHYAQVDRMTLMDWNNLDSEVIRPGDQLIVGWRLPRMLGTGRMSVWTTTPIVRVPRLKIGHLWPWQDVTPPQSVEVKNPFTTAERGLALQMGRDYHNSDLIVMHPTARINSDLSIYNPMHDITVTAKVIGRMPTNAYPDNIRVVISPSVARALRALDQQFIVELAYME